MKTPADTAAGSASANEDQQETQFLPEDKNYRLTGELPAAEKKDDSASSNEDEGEGEGAAGDDGAELEHEGEDEGAENTDDSATSKETADTAAASAAAATQKKTGTKTKETSESRWQKVTRENRELREKLARQEGREEGRSSAEKPRDTAQTSQPAADAEPTLEDIDPKTNKPKYATLADYLSALRKWDRDQTRKEFAEMSTKTQREQQQAEAERVIERTVNERAAAARKVYADYDDTIKDALEIKDEHGHDAFFYVKGSPIDVFFLDSDRGHDVMYAIAKDFDKHGHIFARDAKGNYKLNAVRQVRELAKIENSLPEAKTAAGKSAAGAGSSSARHVTQAPPPPHQTSGTGSVSKDAVEKAVEENDFESYSAAANARALEKRRAGKRTAAASR